jgi:hypothetical protein
VGNAGLRPPCVASTSRDAVWFRLWLGGLATYLDTEHGGTDANKRDGARQLGRLNVAGLQL